MSDNDSFNAPYIEDQKIPPIALELTQDDAFCLLGLARIHYTQQHISDETKPAVDPLNLLIEKKTFGLGLLLQNTLQCCDFETIYSEDLEIFDRKSPHIANFFTQARYFGVRINEQADERFFSRDLSSHGQDFYESMEELFNKTINEDNAPKRKLGGVKAIIDTFAQKQLLVA